MPALWEACIFWEAWEGISRISAYTACLPALSACSLWGLEVMHYSGEERKCRLCLLPATSLLGGCLSEGYKYGNRGDLGLPLWGSLFLGPAMEDGSLHATSACSMSLPLTCLCLGLRTHRQYLLPGHIYIPNNIYRCNIGDFPHAI